MIQGISLAVAAICSLIVAVMLKRTILPMLQNMEYVAVGCILTVVFVIAIHNLRKGRS